jgi:hypothetical protein
MLFNLNTRHINKRLFVFLNTKEAASLIPTTRRGQNQIVVARFATQVARLDYLETSFI